MNFLNNDLQVRMLSCPSFLSETVDTSFVSKGAEFLDHAVRIRLRPAGAGILIDYCPLSHKTKNPKDDGLTPEQRRERDAKALQEKAARKAAQGAVGGNNGGGGRSTKK
ncbi:hypothetical protein OIU77_018647 [Salix suchowensis]|uniref:Small EDRK-rich factor-like N-terminal domain-containing protein n=1 Tax=Salix suchowensis TaxID=1278906 RepID=A0ABQ9CFB6_9ROSI|nr:hypothetical protein OIU77_018647 [Salix suchowensis]